MARIEMHPMVESNQDQKNQFVQLIEWVQVALECNLKAWDSGSFIVTEGPCIEQTTKVGWQA